MKSFLIFLLVCVLAVLGQPPTCGELEFIENRDVMMGNKTVSVRFEEHPWAQWTKIAWIVQLVLFVGTMPLFLWRGWRGHAPLRNRLFILGAVSGVASVCVLTILTALVNQWHPFPPTAAMHAFICVCVSCFFLPFFLRIIRLYGLMQFNLGQYRSVLDDDDDAAIEAQAIGQSSSSNPIIAELKKNRTHMLLLALFLMFVIILDIVGARAIPSVFVGTPLEKVVGHTPFFTYLQFMIKVVIEFFLMIGIVIDIIVFVKNREVLSDSSHILLELCIAMGIFTVEWILSITLQWAPTFKAETGFPGPICLQSAKNTAMGFGPMSDLCYIKPEEFNALNGNALNETCQAWEINFLFTYCCLYFIYHVVVTFPLVMSYMFSAKLARFKLTNVKFELEDLRADPRAHNDLVKFVASEFAFENYAFIDTISRFKTMSATNPNLEEAAQKVATRYIGEAAPLQINISAHTERRIQRDFLRGNITPNMFEAAVKELRPIFQHDIIPRFLADNPMLTNNAEIKKRAVQRIAEEKRERERAAQVARTKGRTRGRSKGRRSKSRKGKTSK